MFVQSNSVSGAFLSNVHEQRFAGSIGEMSFLSRFLGLFKKNDGFSLELVASKVQMSIVECHSQVVRYQRDGCPKPSETDALVLYDLCRSINR